MERGSRAGRKGAEHWKQKHQVQEHIRVLGSNILSDWTLPTQQAETPHGTRAVPGKEAEPGRGWQLPSALQEMLKQVRSHQPAAIPGLQQSLPAWRGTDRSQPVPAPWWGKTASWLTARHSWAQTCAACHARVCIGGNPARATLIYI